ncbi:MULTISPECIES: glycine cleavage T C-terminal barrel domain-containing protein [unclassified Streptomyces]|uniref:glycine cleavage T C-terminal barrel domain-containing protein n=1 Tax=unclassified Streptomyces TaxID=2593676 RepID=UPI0037172E5C
MSFTVAGMRTPPATYAWSRFGAPEYTDWLDESMSWKETCYIGDWSFLWQHRISGPDAIRLLADTSVNSFAVFRQGQSKHAIHTNRDGKVIHEGIVTKFGDDDYVVHGRGGFWLKHRLDKGDYDARITQEDWFVFQVSGPHAVLVLDRLAGENQLRDTKYMHVAPLRIAGHDIWALRQGMAGEIGFELQGPREFGDAVHAAVMEAGQEFGIRRLGARVTMINHLEACFPTIATDYIPAIFDEDMAEYLDVFRASMPAFAQPAYISGSFDGKQISDYYRSPVELGWGRNIKFDHEFLGRAALEREKAEPRRVIRTLEWNAEDVLDVQASLFRPGPHYPFMDMPRDQRGFMWADKVTAGDELVGVATSRGYSYYFRKMISLATVDVAHAEIGTPLTVHWGTPDGPQKAIRAVVAPAPYKQDRSRIDLHSA